VDFYCKKEDWEMSGNLRYKIHLLAAILILTSGPTALCAGGNPERLVSPELLEHTKLKILWENELPIKENESLERLIIIDEHIYALSDLNYMISLDREKGNMIFGNSVAPAGLPIVGLELYGNKLLSLIGDNLVEIDPETGEKLSTWHPELSIVCPIIRNSSYFYLAGTDRRLQVLRAEDMVRVFEVAADNKPMITSIIADENFVIFTTDGGNVISIAPDRPNRLWQFDAAGGVIGPIVRYGNSLFFACKDTNLYRIDMVDMKTVNLVWKYQTNALLDKAPYVTAEVAYQRAGDKGLAAIDKKSGKLLWQLAEGADLLAEANEKAYVITKTKTLVVMDNNKGKRLYSANFAQASRYAANTMDSKIYIANKDGRIACITPVE